MSQHDHKRSDALEVTIWCAAKGGMRAVVEAYIRDGFFADRNSRLIASYVDGSFARRQWVLVRALAQFIAVLATRRVSVVHCHASMHGSFWRKGLFASLARIRGVPVLLHLHGSEFKSFYASQRPFLQRAIRGHLEKATRVLVLSDSWADFIRGIAPRAQIEVLPNHVALPAYVSPALRTGQDVLFLGLIGDRKGTFDLIRAFVRVHAAHPDARLVIGGNGEVDRAAALIESLGLGHAIRLAGWIGPEEKAQLLAAAAIYTLPSRNEGLPVSVLEAMAYGLPVVTSRAGGLPDLVEDGEDGMMVDAGDEDAIANALIRLLDDAALRMKLGEAARSKIESGYSDTIILPQLRSIYTAVART